MSILYPRHMILCHQILLNNSSNYLLVVYLDNIIIQGPVVQSVVNELVKGHFVNCFSGFNIQCSDIFC